MDADVQTAPVEEYVLQKHEAGAFSTVYTGDLTSFTAAGLVREKVHLRQIQYVYCPIIPGACWLCVLFLCTTLKHAIKSFSSGEHLLHGLHGRSHRERGSIKKTLAIKFTARMLHYY